MFERSSLRIVLSNDRDSEPVVLRVLPLGIGRQWEMRIGKAAHSDSTYSRIAIAFQINIAAAFRTEMKADAITAVAAPLINLALAFEPDLVFQVSRAEVKGRASPALASLAVAQVHLLRIARGDRPERSTMAFCRSPRCFVLKAWPSPAGFGKRSLRRLAARDCLINPRHQLRS